MSASAAWTPASLLTTGRHSSSSTLAAERGEVEQEGVAGLVTGLPARCDAAHAGLELGDAAGKVEHLLVGLRRREVVLLEDVGAVGEDRGLGAERDAEQRTGRTGQVALLAAGHAEVLHVAVDQVLGVVARVGEFGVHEEPGEVLDLIGVDVVGLGEHDVADQVVVARVLGQLEGLLLAHGEILLLVHLDTDTRLLGELRQDAHDRVVVRVRGEVGDDGGTGELLVGVGGRDARARAHRGGGGEAEPACGSLHGGTNLLCGWNRRPKAGLPSGRGSSGWIAGGRARGIRRRPRGCGRHRRGRRTSSRHPARRKSSPCPSVRGSRCRARRARRSRCSGSSAPSARRGTRRR